MSSLDEFRSRKVRIFRNGDMFHPGKRFVVSPRIFRNFEQFLLRVSEDLTLVNGAVRRIHTIQGALVRDLEDLQDGGFYVATAGEPFHRIPYPIVNASHAPAPAAHGKRKVYKSATVPPGVGTGVEEEGEDGGEGSHGKKKEVPLFGPSSKAFRVVVFANGEAAGPGLKVVLNYRNCKSYDQLLTLLSSLLRLKSGFVRKLYDAETGKRLTCLQDLKDGQNLVAGSWEPFKKVAYPLTNPNISQFDVKREDDTPRPVTFYPNGDSYHHGFTITLRKTRYPTLKKLIDHLNTIIDLPTGRITRIHTLTGQRLEDMDTLLAIASAPSPVSATFPNAPAAAADPDSASPAAESPTAAAANSSGANPRSFVLACGDDPFYHVPYDLNRVKVRHGPIGLGGATTRNEYLEKIRGVAERRRRDRPQDGADDQQREMVEGVEEEDQRHHEPPKPAKKKAQPPAAAAQQQQQQAPPPASAAAAAPPKKPAPKPPASTRTSTTKPAGPPPVAHHPTKHLARAPSHASEISEDDMARHAEADHAQTHYGETEEPRELQHATAASRARSSRVAAPPARVVDSEDEEEEPEARSRIATPARVPRGRSQASSAARASEAGFEHDVPPRGRDTPEFLAATEEDADAESRYDDDAEPEDEEPRAQAMETFPEEDGEEPEPEPEQEQEPEPEPARGSTEPATPRMAKGGSTSSIPMLKSRTGSKASLGSKQASRRELPGLPRKSELRGGEED
ncbi:hypothetical protein HDU96_010792 [Phlyctochytrium bullatum]|nr:hypothetical protein HDU96_010792 [Phlyctochytrium bullatum]